MPKRRVPGHLNRTGRSRRDRRPNVPADQEPLAPEPTDEAPAEPADAGPAAAPPPTGRLRPTQRAAMGQRFVRSAPPPEVNVDYAEMMRDLRQIGLLGGVAFVILIALTFVIR